ncbi:MAG: hypothetical protein ACR2PZ_11170 [Pseudomonadales bacterium]
MGDTVAMTLEEQAAALLLRSPNLSVTEVMELLDLGDQEFKEIVQRNPAVAKLLETRRLGKLPPSNVRQSTLRQCLTCEEDFLPYAGSRYCSDICARLALVKSRSRVKNQSPGR